MRNVRLHGLFTLRAPLSHIGESISSTSYLAEETILQPDGEPTKIFAYSGNAWRGQLRDLAAAYMLDRLGAPAVSLDAFHLLFTGGRIGGPQSLDLDQARRLRAAIPLVALLGGGVGNQILEGKLSVGIAYPLCREALPVLPREHRAAAERIAYADCTLVREYSRRDDSRIESIARWLPPAGQEALPPPADGKPGKPRPDRPQAKRAVDGGVADQMRIASELVAPGVRLATTIRGRDLSEIELGCLVSGLHRFSLHPHIGGQVGRGHGLVDLTYAITDLDSGRTQAFVEVGEGEALLAPAATAAKQAYDQHLRSLYDQMLEAKGGEIRALLGAEATA